ncbi:DUF4240 domain-containing protein [Massilia sp. CF038]|uniref:DUF4240 domain-containing protein n=1 Tax=Massilia sp. CF038 TaxID=1881045 RepID=UPI00092003A7|nr:DUF4240 domain-containing protein [Massilia sp. CF038]SHH10526.1 Protein of unknown function [Massilia sp. CF038]
MTDPEFWNLIALIDVTALDEGREDEAVEPLQTALNMKSEAELFGFEEALSQNLYAIDGDVFADNAGDSGGSDDGFLYARCFVVAKGQEFYEAVKSDSTRMPKSIEQWCESLLYPHRAAWAKQTGKDQSEWPFEATVSYESGSNAELWHE